MSIHSPPQETALQQGAYKPTWIVSAQAILMFEAAFSKLLQQQTQACLQDANEKN